jgi:hypothetical protein
MRIWGVNPLIMCRAHLLGEHREMHALVGMIKLGISLKGYVTTGLVDTSMIKERHELLVREMVSRSYNHHTPLYYRDKLKLGSIDVDYNMQDLFYRCGNCAARYDLARLKCA